MFRAISRRLLRNSSVRVEVSRRAGEEGSRNSDKEGEVGESAEVLFEREGLLQQRLLLLLLLLVRSGRRRRWGRLARHRLLVDCVELFELFELSKTSRWSKRSRNEHPSHATARIRLPAKVRPDRKIGSDDDAANPTIPYGTSLTALARCRARLASRTAKAGPTSFRTDTPQSTYRLVCSSRDAEVASAYAERVCAFT